MYTPEQARHLGWDRAKKCPEADLAQAKDQTHSVV